MKLIQQIHAHNDIVWHVQPSADNQLLLSCCADGMVNIYDADFNQIQQLQHPQTVRSACFSDDSQKLFVACYDQNVYIYVIEDYQFKPLCIQEKVHSKEIKSIAAYKDLLATCARDRCVHVYKKNQLCEDDYDCVSVLQLHKQDIKQVFFSSKGLLCSVSYDNCIMIYKQQYSADGEDLEYVLQAEYKSKTTHDEVSKNDNSIECTVWSGLFLKNQNQLLVTDAQGYLSMLQIDPDQLKIAQQQKIHESDCYKIANFNNNDLFATCGSDGKINIVQFQHNQFAVLEQLANAHNGEVNAVCGFNGKLVSCGDDGVICVFQ